LQIKTKIISCHAADSKPVKQEVNGTEILPPLVFPALAYLASTSTSATNKNVFRRWTPHDGEVVLRRKSVHGRKVLTSRFRVFFAGVAVGGVASGLVGAAAGVRGESCIVAVQLTNGLAGGAVARNP